MRLDKGVFNIINYRQADAVVVAAAAAAAAAPGAGQPFADHTDRLPHQAVDWHVPVCRPRLPDPLRDAPAVGRRFR